MKHKAKHTVHTRHSDRHAGKRQVPFPHEHGYMLYPSAPSEGSPAEEAQETPAQEAAEDAS